ncbi:6-phosphofructokinase, partial [bacterium]|nr:6-phosphofructokinase [bacterium]
TELVLNLMEDSRTTNRWYVVLVMGRMAGHLALGIGKAAGASLTVIPEEFLEDRISLSVICKILEGAVLKRRVMGQKHGLAVIAEGIAFKLGDRDELSHLLGKEVPVDAAGHPRLSEVPLASILKNELTRRFAERDDKVTLTSHTLGYELRCARPTTSDLVYTRDLGHGGVRLLLDSKRDLPPGVMVTIRAGDLVPVPFDEMINPQTNRTRIRRVDLSSYSYSVARAYMIRVEAADLEDPTMLAALAGEAKMTPHAFRERYERVAAHLPESHELHPAAATGTAVLNGLPVERS